MSATPKPYKPKKSSTLFKETGNVEIYRVSEETRKRVEADTNRIEEQMRQHNHRSRALFRKQENDRIRKNADNFNSMTNRWGSKLSTSPYAVNQVVVEEKRRVSAEERQEQSELDSWRQSLVMSMSGRAALGLAKPEILRGLTPQQRLALQLRQSRRDAKAVTAEHQVLNHMLLEEVQAVRRKFPNMPVPSHLFEEEFAADANFDEVEQASLLQSLGSTGSSFSQMTPALKQRLMPKKPKRSGSRSSSRSPSRGTQGDLPQPVDEDGSLVSDSVSGDYAGPSATMRQLEDDLGQMSLSDLR